MMAHSAAIAPQLLVIIDNENDEKVCNVLIKLAISYFEAIPGMSLFLTWSIFLYY